MDYVVKRPDNKKCIMPVLTSVPELPEGFELLGLATDLPDDVAEIEADKAAEAAQASLVAVVANAVNFGAKLIQDFTVENITLGITQAGMTGTVRKNMVEVLSALQTGSLYDAIAEAKLIPVEKKDATFITDARLLAFVNKIETYLQIPLSTDLL